MTSGDFAMGVVESLLAAVVFVPLSAACSKRARNFYLRVARKLFGAEIEHIFDNPRDAQSDIERELEDATEVLLITGRGNELQRETFQSLLAMRPAGRAVSFRILLPEVRPPERQFDWTAQRETELASIDPAFGQGLLKDQIDTSVRFLHEHVQNGAVHLRFFNCPHIGRILITERTAYFTPYRSSSHGRDSRVMKCAADTEMYRFLRRLFVQLWDAGGR